MMALALVIDLLGSAYIAAAMLGVAWSLVRGASIRSARAAVADAVVTGLSFKLAVTLLRTLELSDWKQIGTFAALLALRTALKRVFAWEGRLEG